MKLSIFKDLTHSSCRGSTHKTEKMAAANSIPKLVGPLRSESSGFGWCSSKYVTLGGAMNIFCVKKSCFIMYLDTLYLR